MVQSGARRRGVDPLEAQLLRDRSVTPTPKPGVLALVPFVDIAYLVAWDVKDVMALRALLESIGLMFREESPEERQIESLGLLLASHSRAKSGKTSTGLASALRYATTGDATKMFRERPAGCDWACCQSFHRSNDAACPQPYSESLQWWGRDPAPRAFVGDASGSGYALLESTMSEE